MSRHSLIARPSGVSLHEWIKEELLGTRSPFRRDFRADGATADTLRAIVSGDIEGVFKHADDLNALITIVETQFRLLDLAWVCFMVTPTQATYEILLKIVGALDVPDQISAYNMFASHVTFTSERLRTLTKQIVITSKFPITTALVLASRCYHLSKQHVGRHGLLIAEADFCTKLSTELVKNIGNEHLAALALQVRDPALGGSALEMALSTNNMVFVADPIVSRILFNIWAIPRYLKEQTFCAQGYVPVHYRLDVLLQRNPKEFLETNRVKFQFQIILIWVYVLLVSHSTLARVSIRSAIAVHEMAVWILGIGYISVEIAEIRRLTVERYCRSGWNCVGVCLWTAMLIEIFIRLLGSQGLFTNANLEGAQVVLWASQSLFIVLLWLKLMRQFTVLHTIGVLHRTLPLLAGYIAHFSLFLSVSCMGFGIALKYTVGDAVESYHTVFGAWFTLYLGALSQYSFSDFAELSVGKRILAQTLLGVFLLISTLILFKTMIVAILNSTYRRVRDHSELEYGFGFAQLIVETHAENCVLPAPVNLLIYVLASPILAWNAIKQRAIPPVDGWICAYCYSRNPLRNRLQILDVLKTWILNLEVCNVSLLECLPLQEIELCGTCHSLKKPISGSELIREQLSFCIFFVVLWIPITLLLWIQQIMQKVIWIVTKCSPKQTNYRKKAKHLFRESNYRSSRAATSLTEGPAIKLSISSSEENIRAWVNRHLERNFETPKSSTSNSL